MLELPEYKLGDLLECIDGIKYSRVKVLTNNNIIILYGDNSGDIIHISDWVSMIKDYNGKIHIINTLDNIYLDPIYSYENTPTNNNLSIRTSSNRSVTFNPVVDIKIIEHDNRRRSILDILWYKPNHIIESDPEPLEQSEPKPIKKSKLPWYYNIFLCCVDLD
jgi:hypothetical protein